MGLPGVIDRTEAPRSFAAITPLVVAHTFSFLNIRLPVRSRALAALAPFGKAWWCGKADARPIRWRADEFDTSGFQGRLHVQQGRGAAGRDIINELKTLDCSQSNARPCGKLFC